MCIMFCVSLLYHFFGYALHRNLLHVNLHAMIYMSVMESSRTCPWSRGSSRTLLTVLGLGLGLGSQVLGLSQGHTCPWLHNCRRRWLDCSGSHFTSLCYIIAELHSLLALTMYVLASDLVAWSYWFHILGLESRPRTWLPRALTAKSLALAIALAVSLWRWPCPLTLVSLTPSLISVWLYLAYPLNICSAFRLLDTTALSSAYGAYLIKLIK